MAGFVMRPSANRRLENQVVANSFADRRGYGRTHSSDFCQRTAVVAETESVP